MATPERLITPTCDRAEIPDSCQTAPSPSRAPKRLLVSLESAGWHSLDAGVRVAGGYQVCLLDKPWLLAQPIPTPLWPWSRSSRLKRQDGFHLNRSDLVGGPQYRFGRIHRFIYTHNGEERILASYSTESQPSVARQEHFVQGVP